MLAKKIILLPAICGFLALTRQERAYDARSTPLPPPLRGCAPARHRRYRSMARRCARGMLRTRFAATPAHSHVEGGVEGELITPERVEDSRSLPARPHADKAQGRAQTRPRSRARGTSPQAATAMDGLRAGSERSCQGRSQRSWSHEVRSLTGRKPAQSAAIARCCKHQTAV
jgi:hypothetical protein